MNSHSPLRLPVRTQSGRALGHVVDLEIDSDSQQVTLYHVKPSRLLPDMVSAPLLIRSTQVVDITEREMVVDDALADQRQMATAPGA